MRSTNTAWRLTLKYWQVAAAPKSWDERSSSGRRQAKLYGEEFDDYSELTVKNMMPNTALEPAATAPSVFG